MSSSNLRSEKEKTYLEDLGRLVFGPVPSRRLGQSLGINNIPPKSCSYSCVYCQLGKTTNMSITRKPFYEPDDIFEQVKKKVNKAISKNERSDYLTFVPDGEPTLDVNLGRELSLLKQIGVSRAVITNASLIGQEEVKEDLLKADFVSFKIDSLNEGNWKRINRPHKGLNLETILEGITEFAGEFKGILVSETMLIDRIDYIDEFLKIAKFLKHLKKLDKAYIAIPTRPPTEKWIKPAKEETVNAAFQALSKKLGGNRVEYLIGYEGNAFTCTEKVAEDLLGIMAVHPMRREALQELLRKTNSDWNVIEQLFDKRKIIMLEYEGNEYYMRRFPNRTFNHA